MFELHLIFVLLQHPKRVLLHIFQSIFRKFNFFPDSIGKLELPHFSVLIIFDRSFYKGGPLYVLFTLSTNNHILSVNTVYLTYTWNIYRWLIAVKNGLLSLIHTNFGAANEHNENWTFMNIISVFLASRNFFLDFFESRTVMICGSANLPPVQLIIYFRMSLLCSKKNH